MASAKLDLIFDRLQRATTLDDLRQVITALRDHYNVEHIVYHSVNSTGQQYGAVTYSAGWVDHYLENDYARIDPVVQGCYRRFHPVDWKTLDWSPKPIKEFLGEAIDAGVGNQGLSVPIRGPSGQFALFTVSDRSTDNTWMKLSEEHMSELILTAHFVNQKALEIERGTDKVHAANLSPREVDALTFIAMGYSRAQAADALTISEHTLRVYLESARFKLGAQNTIHAVARALTLGLLVV